MSLDIDTIKASLNNSLHSMQGERLMLKTGLLAGIMCCFFTCLGVAHAEIETRLVNTVNLSQAIVDMDVSTESGLVVCLTEKGQVLVYDSAGKPQGQVDVGPGFDAVRLGPKDDTLYLSETQKGLVKVFDLILIQDISIEGSPFQGPENAPVVLVMFMDFQCPYCVRLHGVVDDLRKEFPNDLKVVLKHFPLASHKFSMKAAQASMAAMEQGKFWEYFAKISADYRDLNDQKLEEFRDALGLDKGRFGSVMHSPKTAAKINRDKDEGIALGVEATPTVFVNGRRIKPLSSDSLKKSIEDILKHHKK